MNHENVYQLFDRRAEELPDQPAISRAGADVSYRELQERTNRLANFLLASGLEKGSVVAVLTRDTVEAITAVVAVLKAGGVFVPLDPDIPERRLRAMIEEVSPGWFVVDSEFLHITLPTDHNGRPKARVLLLGGGGETARGAGGEGEGLITLRGFDEYADAGRPGVASDPDDMCYVYFTSGTTGHPKGIAGRLKGIDHFIRWEIETLGVGPGARASQLLPLSFDGSLRDIFVPLCAGGTVVIPEGRDTLLDARLLAEWIDRERITLIHCIPSLLRALLDAGLTAERFAALRHVLLSGEALLPSDVGRWSDVFGGRIQLVNLYGTSETTMAKFIHFVTEADRGRRSVPVGRPMPGARALIVNEQGAPCPPGVVGEIYIRTPYRSLGYYNRPELTREVFVSNSFGADPEDVVYRTGDLGRVLEDGSVELLGRKDQQVKIRGARVELSEVEGLLRSTGGVRDVAVIDREDFNGNKYLCAYVVGGEEEADFGALRAHLATHLPDYMIPSAFIRMEKLPRTISGKVERRSLPTPGEALAGRKEYVAPGTPTEEALAAVWTEVLGIARVSARDNFFELGGHSLLATQVMSRVRAGLGVELPLRVLFARPVLTDLAQYVETQSEGGGAAGAPRVEPAPRTGPLPLSFAQQRLWFLDQLEPGSPAYNISAALRLSGRLNTAALEQCLNEVVRRHESLRTTFTTAGEEPAQETHGPRPVRPTQVELSRLPDGERERVAERLAREESRRPFDLAAGPLLRVSLLRLAPEDHVVLFTMHHIVSDGWSMGVLIREVSDLYGAFSRGEPSGLAELAVQYADFAVWQRRQLQGEVLEGHLSYWREQLRDAAPLLALPGDRPRPPARDMRGASHDFRLPAQLSADLKALSRDEGATLFMTLLAAFKALLMRYTGQEDIVVGSAIANRNTAEIEPLIGFFVNSLAMRTNLAGDPSFRELLGRVRKVALEAYSHQDLPFEKVVELLQPRRNLGYSPVYQVEFTLQNAPAQALRVPGLELSPVSTPQESVETDFNFIMSEGEEGLLGTVVYPVDMFDAATVGRMMRHYRTLLEGAVADPDRRLSQLPLMPEEELRRFVSRPGAAASASPPAESFQQLFELAVERAPDATALVFRDRHLTYRELNRRANQLARHLRRQGAGPESRVGVYLESSPEMVVAVLGVLKAGAAYIPLDPAYPKERLAYMMDDARVGLLLTEEGLAAQLPRPNARAIYLDADWPAISREADTNPPNRTRGEDLAYCIYTSGSTGAPNGVLITHGSLVSYTHSIAGEFGLRAGDRILQFASLSFDVSVEELFPALARGAAVVLRDESLPPTFSELTRAVGEQRLTLFELPTAYWHGWVDELSRARTRLPASLRLVIIGGEKVSARRLADWRALGVPLLHVYGLTEATVTSTTYELPAGDEEPAAAGARGAELPIGRPVVGAQVHLLDARMQPVPVGVPGEIYVGGDGLARGYLNRPALTAARFVPDPFSAAPGARLYKTGDLARRLASGDLVFLGRIDLQMKVRGYRIEPGEVEGALRQHPLIQDAAVVARPASGNGHARLVRRRADGSVSLASRGELVAALSSLGEEEAGRLFAEVEALTEQEVETNLALDLQVGGEGDQVKIRRHPQFDIILKLKDDRFITPPQEAQRNWLIRRTLDEFAADLRHLDAVSKQFVPGSARPRLAPRLEWNKSDAHYDESQLIIAGQQVMQDWEAPLMRAMAEVVTESHGDILELGFGMGISASYIQEFGVRSYTVVEYNDEVVERFRQWKRRYPGRDINLIHGRWHDVTDRLGTYDGIFFDTVPTYEDEYLREVIDNVVMAEDFFPVAARCLRPGGVFTWYTNEIDTLSRRHQRLIMKYFDSFTVSVARPLSPPEDCHYWFADSMVVVKAVK